MAVVGMGLLGSGAAQASLIISVGSTTVAAGGSGFVDITLQNTSSSAFATPIDGFSAVFSSSNAFVSFTSGSMATTAPYIFASNSGDTNLAVPFFTTPPASIADFAFAGTGTTIGGLATLGLGRIFFSVGAGASAGIAPITLTTNGTTNLTDVNGANIPSTLSNGQITITTTTGVPEPSTFAPLGLLLLTGVVGGWRRRSA